MMEAVIEFDRVTKLYRLGGVDVRALDGVSVSFRSGEFWAVMGPSGSGKSTMLNLLGCLDRPTSGRCLLDGVDVSTLDDDALSRARLQGIGFVFQSFNLIPQLTVRENIELPLFYMGGDVHDCMRRARELAEMVGLGDRLHHRPTELSGGQRQRVAIARALANEPAVILADEPTGNLDTATGLQIMNLLAGLHRDGRTIIMVTHEPDIAAFASHRLHLRDGRIERIEVPS
jgi:putative ABC transport system ATP-binding protein